MSEHLEGLNPQQKEAVLHTQGPLLVLAGAGAGKTRVIVSRIIHLIHEGVSPNEVLAITFTNKAAKEMKERVEQALSKNTNVNRPVFQSTQATPFVSTFHSLGVHILKEHAHTLGLPKYFTILDRSDSISIIKRAMKVHDIDPKQWEPRKIISIISKEKGKGVHAHEYGNSNEFSFVRSVVKPVWNEYEKIKNKEGALDFDDLLVKAVSILQKNPEIKRSYQNRWKYLHIDEYQDTNTIQYTFGQLLLGPANNICVVGDADQSIYTWRGANIQNILDFENDFPNARTVLLEENYRSTQNIIRAAQDIIQKNTLRKEKTLFTNNHEGEKLSALVAIDEAHEGEIIAGHIQNLLDKDVSPQEIAILYRTNFQSRVLEDAMLRNNIPYELLGTRFFDRKEVKDALSYIRLALNPKSITDLTRVINTPRRGIGKATLAKIVLENGPSLTPATQKKVDTFWQIIEEIQQAIESEKPSTIMKTVLEKSGLVESYNSKNEDDKERIDNLKELVSYATRFDDYGESGVEKMMEEIALVSDQDTLNNEKGGVRLMTVHASKGLEFDYVFITGLEDGLFPQERDDATLEEREEERRLFYVALTRARKKVFLSHASSRIIFGSRNFTVPSEFLLELDEELIENEDVNAHRPIKTIYLD